MYDTLHTYAIVIAVVYIMHHALWNGGKMVIKQTMMQDNLKYLPVNKDNLTALPVNIWSYFGKRLCIIIIP